MKKSIILISITSITLLSNENLKNYFEQEKIKAKEKVIKEVNISENKYKSKFETNENAISGYKGDPNIYVNGVIKKVREYNDYYVLEILTDRNEIIEGRFNKKRIYRENQKISNFCRNWNVMEYEYCN